MYISQPNRISKETFERTDELIRLSADAVREAQEDSRAEGVPNVYSINGRIYREGPDGLVRDGERNS